MLLNITPGQLRKAAVIKEKIEGLEAELRLLLGESAATGSTNGKTRHISAAGRARIAAAARRRWAKVHAAAGGRPVKPAPSKKFSPAARARLAAIARARWAKVRAAGKTKL